MKLEGILRDPVSVWLTRAGRATARVGTGIRPAPTTPPKGLLKGQLWRQLAEASEAERDGPATGRCTGRTTSTCVSGTSNTTAAAIYDTKTAGPAGTR